MKKKYDRSRIHLGHRVTPEMREQYQAYLSRLSITNSRKELEKIHDTE